MCSPFRVCKLPQDVISCCSLRLHFRDVSAVAKCSVKSNSQVGWGWSISSITNIIIIYIMITPYCLHFMRMTIA